MGFWNINDYFLSPTVPQLRQSKGSVNTEAWMGPSVVYESREVLKKEGTRERFPRTDHSSKRSQTFFVYFQVSSLLLLLFNCYVTSDCLQHHGLQHTRLPCCSMSLGVCQNSCPLRGWCHPTISPSATPFYSCPQSFPASGSFPMSQLFPSGGQSIGASASVLPMNIQGWFPLGFSLEISNRRCGMELRHLHHYSPHMMP